ncbi:MAG: hypothetical protein L0241_27195 [Planctomycetia bacterium]|nr:hypothetical protein [Planctomycetia bacterium]
MNDTLYIVVVLGSSTCTVPGSDAQTFLLLDARGRLLDRLICEINSRLTRRLAGRFYTSMHAMPLLGQVHLVTHLDWVDPQGSSYCLHHRGVKARFFWEEESSPDDRFPAGKPPKLDLEGLCCIAVQAGQFRVLFPVK